MLRLSDEISEVFLEVIKEEEETLVPKRASHVFILGADGIALRVDGRRMRIGRSTRFCDR